MPIYQLRTYHLASPGAMADYLPRWQPHIESLRAFGVETHGFFSVPTDPCAVIALVSYADGTDPDAIIRAYMASDAFKADMAGFDMSQMRQVETLMLRPGYGSPLG
jgi:hypothetical protein